MEKFLMNLSENADLREEFMKQTTAEGAYRVAKPYLDANMDQETFITNLLNVAKSIEDAETHEMSEDDLAAVSGGFGSNFLQGWVNKGYGYLSSHLSGDSSQASVAQVSAPFGMYAGDNALGASAKTSTSSGSSTPTVTAPPEAPSRSDGGYGGGSYSGSGYGGYGGWY